MRASETETTYERIAVPLDSTADSEQALPLAAAIARRSGGEVRLVQAVNPPVLGEAYATAVMDAAAVTEVERVAGERLARLANRLATHGVRASTDTLEGPIARALADFVEADAADLVVMTTHDRGRLDQLLLGSVTRSVVRRVRQPVLLVHANAPSVGGMEMADFPLRHLLVALDGSGFANQVVPHARELARLMGARVTLFSALTPARPLVALDVLSPRGLGPVHSDPEAEADITNDRRAELEAVAASFDDEGIATEVAVVADDDAVSGIEAHLATHDVDALALTTHGRSALGRAMAGSVAQSVLRRILLPTLLLHPH